MSTMELTRFDAPIYRLSLRRFFLPNLRLYFLRSWPRRPEGHPIRPLTQIPPVFLSHMSWSFGGNSSSPSQNRKSTEKKSVTRSPRTSPEHLPHSAP